MGIKYIFNPITGSLDAVSVGTPAGATTQVQFNDAGAFGGDSGLTFNKTTDALSAGGFIPTSSTVPANGVYLPVANSVGVATNGQGRLFVDASGNVGVGIVSTTLWGYANLAGGTTVHRLLARQADAFLGISGTSTTAELNFGLLNALSSPTLVARISTVNTITTNNGERADLAFYTKSGAVSTVAQERLRITSAGLVGIGSSAPQSKLDVIGADVSFPGLKSADAPTTVVANAATNTYVRVAGGLYGSASSVNLDLSVGQAKNTNISSGWRLKAKASATVSNPSGSDFQIIPTTLPTTTAANFTEGTPALTILNTGAVGIGTTSPGYTLVLSATSANIEINDFTSPDATSETGIRFSNNATNHALLGRFGSQDFRISNTGNIVFATGGISTANEKARLTSSGQLLVGTSTAQTIGNSQAQIEVSTDSASGYALSLSRSFTDIYGPQINFRSTKGTAASPVIVDNGDQLGSIAFYGYDGTDSNHQFASITAFVDGTPGNNDCPGRLVFSTTADGASSPTERMRITSAGLVGIGTSAPADLLHLGGATNKQLRIDSSSSPSYVGSYNGTLNLAANRRTSDGIIVDSARSAAYIGISSDVGPSSVTISTASAINTQPAARVTVNGSGNVGIGTSAPTALLEVFATINSELRLNTSADGYLQIGQFANGASIGTSSADATAGALRFVTAGSEKARFDTSGRLGIGVTSPETLLHLSSSTDTYQTIQSTSASNNAVTFYKNAGIASLGFYTGRRVSNSDGAASYYQRRCAPGS
jgi:hypothetical protein